MTTTSRINEERPELGLYKVVYCIFLKQRHVTFIGDLCCCLFFLFYAWKQLNKQTNKQRVDCWVSLKIVKHQRIRSDAKDPIGVRFYLPFDDPDMWDKWVDDGWMERGSYCKWKILPEVI